MTHMDDTLEFKYVVVGFGQNTEVWMTEYKAIRKTDAGYDVKVTDEEPREVAPPDDDEYECTCLPDLPNGAVNGGRGKYCATCEKYFEDLLEEEVPL